MEYPQANSYIVVYYKVSRGLVWIMLLLYRWLTQYRNHRVLESYLILANLHHWKPFVCLIECVTEVRKLCQSPVVNWLENQGILQLYSCKIYLMDIPSPFVLPSCTARSLSLLFSYRTRAIKKCFSTYALWCIWTKSVHVHIVKIDKIHSNAPILGCFKGV